ncbi:MAG: phenylalanine--tRNA ligase subunit alpha [Anaerolineae bacterium]
MVSDAVRSARRAAEDALERATDLDALEEWRIKHLGRGGNITGLLRQISELPADERPGFGAQVNEAKVALQEAFDRQRQALTSRAVQATVSADRIDVTLPGVHPPTGGLHPSTQTLRRIYDIFADMGFQVYQSREVETDEYNFELLNMPRYHPARDMQDTFYVNEDIVLRTHTSPGQIHAMREYAPEPVRIILPGMCYRNEQITARSEIQFYQVEGLAVGEGITMADLKGTIESFARRMYGADRGVRFRASYFPFTEPSAEVDISCNLCDGEGCRVCKHTGWLEIMGAGMVHPAVLANGGYDPERFTGFAFGGGVERGAMLRYGIDDIRMFWSNDLRFLEQLR